MLYKTGIAALDVQLGGGIPVGTVLLLLEEPGAGGDIFTYHIASEGAKNGENVLYFATDDPAEEIKENVEKIGFSNFTLISLKSKGEEDLKGYLRRSMHDVIGGLRAILKNEKFNRVLINSLTYFLSKYSFEDVLSLLEFFSSDAEEKKSIYVLLLTKGMFDSKVEVAMKHICDAVFELSLQESEAEIIRRLKFIKFKGVEIPRTIMRYDLTEKGVRMETTIRVI